MRHLPFILALGTVIAIATASPSDQVSGAESAHSHATPVNQSPVVHQPAGARDRRIGRYRGQLQEFILADFSFGGAASPDPQGWTSHDRTGQPDTFFHVADATELDGGPYGNLVVLEGIQSMWCGVPKGRGGEFCRWATLPGYGNSWDQSFASIKFSRSGDVTLSYKIFWDVEPFEDRVYVQFLDKNESWRSVFIDPPFKDYYDKSGFQNEQITLPDSVLGDSIQIRFHVRTDAAWSDEDGLNPTEGACIIDSLTLSDETGVLSFQDFEAEPVGAHATNDGHWSAFYLPSQFGDFAGLFPVTTLVQEDICSVQEGAAWGFFAGSPDDYGCGGFPEQRAVPFGRTTEGFFGPGKIYIWNEIWSPLIDWMRDRDGTDVPASAASARIEFDVYRDLPFENLVAYYWGIRSIKGGCAGEWRSTNSYVGERAEWHRHVEELALHVDPDAEQVQIALGVIDFCGGLCGTVPTPDCHSHAPLIDNVRLVRVATDGPLIGASNASLFQDNFPSDETTSGTVRMDRSFGCCGLRGDSACVSARTPLGVGLHDPGDPGSGPAVYLHVKDIPPGKSGDAVSGDLGVWPVVGSSNEWTVLQCSPGRSLNAEYCVDLNDMLYTPGDTIWYYFSAGDAAGNTTYWSRDVGSTPVEDDVRANPNEVTCLPANARSGGTDILYIDDFDGGAADRIFQETFARLGVKPDRFDVLARGPGAWVPNVLEQIVGCYKTIIWDSGDIAIGTIGDTDDRYPIFSNDFALLFTFLARHPDGPGLYLSGDNLASEWSGLTGSDAINVRLRYMDFALVDDDHGAGGGPLSPVVIGEPGTCFSDSLVAAGGCPSIAAFDVVQPSGGAQTGMTYSGNAARGAVLAQAAPNVVGDTARVVLSGFSFHKIEGSDVREAHLRAILRWLGNKSVEPPLEPPAPAGVTSLAQNYPNPFNPGTIIRYTVGEPVHVTLRIYDVSGRLIKTLVDEAKRPNPNGHSVEWAGDNGAGEPVASGIYWYRLVAGGQIVTRKMVRLR